MKRKLLIGIMVLGLSGTLIACGNKDTSISEANGLEENSENVTNETQSQTSESSETESIDTEKNESDNNKDAVENNADEEIETENEYWQESDNINDDGTYIEPSCPEILASVPKKYLTVGKTNVFAMNKDRTFIYEYDEGCFVFRNPMNSYEYLGVSNLSNIIDEFEEDGISNATEVFGNPLIEEYSIFIYNDESKNDFSNTDDCTVLSDRPDDLHYVSVEKVWLVYENEDYMVVYEEEQFAFDDEEENISVKQKFLSGDTLIYGTVIVYDKDYFVKEDIKFLL